MYSSLLSFALFASSGSSKELHKSLQTDLTCCPLNYNEDSCVTETGASCVWLNLGNYEEAAIYQEKGSQCVGQSYYNCKMADSTACCGPCPGSGSDGSYSVPITAPGDPKPSQCSPYDGLPSSPTTSQFGVDSGMPGIVADRINAAKEPGCKSNIDDCWEQDNDVDFSTHSYQFDGVVYDEFKSACCYKYVSTFNGNTDCTGKSPAQSHWLLDIACEEGKYEVVSPSGVDYTLDKSVCYNGIKFDVGCNGECEYAVCIRYPELARNVCPQATGFIANKAGKGVAFVSIDGVPSCHPLIPELDNKHQELMANAQHIVDQTLNAHHQTLIMQSIAAALLVVVAAGILLAWYCRQDKYKQYKSIPDESQTA